MIWWSYLRCMIDDGGGASMCRMVLLLACISGARWCCGGTSGGPCRGTGRGGRCARGGGGCAPLAARGPVLARGDTLPAKDLLLPLNTTFLLKSINPISVGS